MKMHIESIQNLTHLLDGVMPGIKPLLSGWNESSGKNELADFANEYWHYDDITKKSEKQFFASYIKWAKKNGYRQNQDKAAKIYCLAKSGIPTISSGNPTTKMLVQEAVRMQKEVDNTLKKLLTQIQSLAKSLPEYLVVRAMDDASEVVAAKLIAEIGDVRRFQHGKALISYAGIDSPPYQSGQFTEQNRRISKRGSAYLRKIGYEVMQSLKMHGVPDDDSVYQFILKKELEGKSKKAEKIAELNKLLQIYYARAMEVYRQKPIKT